MKNQRFPIGLSFELKRGKQSTKHHAVVDVLRTYNASGELTKVEYVTETDYLGQKMSHTFPDATIAKALVSKGGNEALTPYLTTDFSKPTLDEWDIHGGKHARLSENIYDVSGVTLTDASIARLATSGLVHPKHCL